MKNRVSIAVGMFAAGGLLLTACGSAPTLDEAWPEVRKNFEEAESLRVNVEATGEEDDNTGTVDLAGATDDSHMKGAMDISMGGDPVEMEVLRLDGDAYLKVKSDGEDNAFTEMLGDKWLKMSASEAEGMGEFAMSSLVDQMVEDMPKSEHFEGHDIEAEEVEIDGEKYDKYVIPEDLLESEDAGDVYYVDRDDNTLFRVEGTKTEDGGQEAVVTFTDWNEVEAPEAPAEDEVMDQSELMNR